MPSKKLPDSVIHLLKSSSSLHLATCLNNVPHVSLMNYTYIHHGDNDYIIISTPINTTKYENMLSNPNVSLLAHDWISLKSEDKKQDQAPSRRNSLYELLANINKNELNRVSVMLNGKAEIVGREDQKFDFFNGLHLNNPKIEESQVKNYIECEHNALVVIKIDTCKVTDTDNNVSQYERNDDWVMSNDQREKIEKDAVDWDV